MNCTGRSLRLCFLKTPLDQVMVHEEKTNANLMKHHIKTIAQCQRPFTRLTKLTQR